MTTIAADDGTVGVFLGGGQKLVLGGDATHAGGASPTPTIRPRCRSASPKAARRAPFPTASSPAARSPACCASRTTTSAMRAACSASSPRRSPAASTRSRRSASTSASRRAAARRCSRSAPRRSRRRRTTRRPAACRSPRTSTAAACASRASRSPSSRPATLQPSDYELVADPSLPAGSYRLTRLSDGTTQTVGDGDVVDGFRIDIAAPAPAARDRFLLQPVSPATRDIARVLDDPKGIAAASPVTATVGAANTGTAAVASLAAVSAVDQPEPDRDDHLHRQQRRLQLQPGRHDRRAADRQRHRHFDRRPADRAERLRAEAERRAAQPATRSPSPRPRSRPATTATPTRCSALRDATFVGQRTLAGGVVAPGVNVTDAYAVGARRRSACACRARARRPTSRRRSPADAKTAVAEKSGVNLDEEAARLIQFQQSYQAAAKMLQVAQSVFDTLLQIGTDRPRARPLHAHQHRQRLRHRHRHPDRAARPS